MGSMCVSSCRCYVFVSVVHPLAILSAVFCDICSLLMFVSDVSVLSICIVLRAFVVIYMCLLYVNLGSRVSPSIFGLMFMGSVMLVYL